MDDLSHLKITDMLRATIDVRDPQNLQPCYLRIKERNPDLTIIKLTNNLNSPDPIIKLHIIFKKRIIGEIVLKFSPQDHRPLSYLESYDFLNKLATA